MSEAILAPEAAHCSWQTRKSLFIPSAPDTLCRAESSRERRECAGNVPGVRAGAGEPSRALRLRTSTGGAGGFRETHKNREIKIGMDR